MVLCCSGGSVSYAVVAVMLRVVVVAVDSNP